MISLKQTAASATGSGLSILAKAARLGIGFPYYILNTVIATFFVMMIFAVFGLGGDTSYWKIGLMLASILFIVPVVLRSLDYKQARDFLAWVIREFLPGNDFNCCPELGATTVMSPGIFSCKTKNTR